MTVIQGETAGIGGSAHEAAYTSVAGKEWMEVLLGLSPVADNILAGATGDELSSKTPMQLATELNEQLGELRPPAVKPVRLAFEGVNDYLTRRARYTHMMRLCNIADAIGAVRRAEGVEVSDGEQRSLDQLDNLAGYYSQMYR
jgi:hypothetical protein